MNDRRAGVRPPSSEELAAGYIGERLTMAELAERHRLTKARVLLLLRRCGIERRPGRHSPGTGRGMRKCVAAPRWYSCVGRGTPSPSG